VSITHFWVEEAL
jgi:hypothetical protein